MVMIIVIPLVAHIKLFVLEVEQIKSMLLF